MGQREEVTCPTCGSPVSVVSSHEGTSYYRPLPPETAGVWLVMLGMDTQHENHVVSVHHTEQEAYDEAAHKQSEITWANWTYYASGPWLLVRKGD
jgi:hypothetical protein